MANDGSVKIGIDLDTAKFKAALGSLGSVAKTGLAATAGAIAAVGGALGAGTLLVFNYGKAYETAFAGVKKTITATDEELKQISGSIRQMAKDMPTAATEIAGVAEAAGQLGIKKDDIMGFTKTMTMLGDTTNLSAEAAATELARLANITGMSQKDFDRLGSTVVALGNNLATTEAEITAMGLRLAGAGKQVGMTEAQILGFAGALSSVGIEAEAGGSAFSKVMVDMQLAAETGGDKLTAFADVAGMSAADFAKAFKTDAAGAMLTFIDGLGKTEERGLSAIKVIDDMGITEVRMRDALLRASGASEVFSDALTLGTDAWKDNTALVKEAEQRYATVDSKLDILKNTFIDLGISIYQSSDNAITKTLKLFNSFAQQLSEAFEKDGLEGVVNKVGDIFAQLSTKIAQSTPMVISSATKLMQAFVKGISDNSNKIAKSGVQMGKSIIIGIKKTVPGIVKTAGIIMSEFAKEIGRELPLLKPFTSVIAVLTDNLGNLTIAAVAVGSGFAVFKIISSVDTMMKGFVLTTAALNTMMQANALQLVAASGGLTLYETVVGLVTGKLTLAAAAQGLFNGALIANPIGLAIALFTALVAAVALYAASLDNVTTESEKAAEASRQTTEKLKAEAEAYEELNTAQEKQALSDIAQIDHARALYDELVKITDENGNITKANKARAEFIVGELNRALGSELEIIGLQISGYKDLAVGIEDTILAKKAEILLEAKKETYVAAIENVSKAKEAERQATYDLTEAQRAMAAADAEATAALTSGSRTRLGVAIKEYNEVSKSLQEKQAAYDYAATEFKRYTDDIVNYSNAAVAAKEGDSQKVIDILVGEQAAFVTAKDVVGKTSKEQEEILARQYADCLIDLDNYVKEYGKSNETMHKNQIELLKKQAEDAGAESKKIGISIVDGTIIGINGTRINLKNTIQSLYKNVEEWAREAIDSHSPSKDFMDIGSDIVDGGVVGIKDNAYKLQDTVDDAFDFEVDNPQTELSVADMFQSGEKAGDGFMDGFLSVIRKLDIAVAATISSMTPQFAYLAKVPNAGTTTNDNGIVINLTVENISSEMDIDRTARRLGEKTQQQLRSKGVLLT